MEFNNVLEAIAYYYGSDKCPQIGHFYTEYYYGLLKDKRESIKKLLEIGVGAVENMNCHCDWYQDAASLYMWQDFLPRAQIYGIDILPSLVFKDNRIETFLCDQYSKEDLEKLIDKIGSDIDIVIDDGSHKPKHQVFTCRTLMPLLKKDVIYIIEDVGRPSIVYQLQDYDWHIVRKSQIKHPNDRLIIIKNKK